MNCSEGNEEPRVFRKTPTKYERAQLEAGQSVGTLILRSATEGSVAEEALAYVEHPYVFSDTGPGILLVSPIKVAQTLRTMHPDDRPDSKQYEHAAEGIASVSEVFAIPYSLIRR